MGRIHGGVLYLKGRLNRRIVRQRGRRSGLASTLPRARC